jgi:hypothetical protein
MADSLERHSPVGRRRDLDAQGLGRLDDNLEAPGWVVRRHAQYGGTVRRLNVVTHQPLPRFTPDVVGMDGI